MNKLVPFSKFSKKAAKIKFLAGTSVVIDGNKTPAGFLFGRDAFISLLESIDESFQEKVSDPKQAFDNPAGRLIDIIEENLPLNPKFVKELKVSISKTKKDDLVSLDEISRALHV